jgi:hypothetical protein
MKTQVFGIPHKNTLFHFFVHVTNDASLTHFEVITVEFSRQMEQLTAFFRVF